MTTLLTSPLDQERQTALRRMKLLATLLLLALFASHPSTMARIAQAWLWAERH